MNQNTTTHPLRNIGWAIRDGFQHYPSTMARWLSHFKISPEELYGLRIVGRQGSTEFYYTLLQVLLYRQVCKDRVREARLAELRHFWRGRSRYDRQRPVTNLSAKALTHLAGFEQGDVAGLVQSFCKSLGYWDCLYLEGGQIKCEQAATFSYDQCEEWKGALEMYQTLTCPECGATETTTEDEGIESLSEFTHVTGPYCSCEACDHTFRFKFEPASELPAGAEYGEDAWECYVDSLCELVADGVTHCKANGLPEPEKLLLAAQRIDWRGSDATAECAVDGKQLAEKMTVNSDFCINNGRLYLRRNGTFDLYCSMSHHDSMGAPIHITPAWLCEVADEMGWGEGYLITPDQLAEAKELAKVSQRLLCGEHRAYPYGPAQTFTLVSRDGFKEAIELLLDGAGIDEAQWELRGDQQDHAMDAAMNSAQALLYFLAEDIKDASGLRLEGCVSVFSAAFADYLKALQLGERE